MAKLGAEIGGTSPRSRLRRLPELGSYDTEEIYPILDATTLCHLATIVDGLPMVLPSLYVRVGRTLLVHGSRSSRLLRSMTESPSICVSVTIVDGLIVARSTFNSSMAYRSVSVFGPARLLEGEEKEAALEKLINGFIPGRSSEVRPSSESEISRTSVLEVMIEEASAKISVGPPDDDEEDVEGPAWAGVIPFRVITEEPIPAPDGAVGAGTVPVPASVQQYRERDQ